MLLALDQDVAAQIFRAMPRDKVEDISREIANIT